MIRSFLALTLFVILNSTATLAAPCCGGGGGSVSIITNDDAATASAAMSRGVVIGDAPVTGVPVFRSSNNNEITQSLAISGSHIFYDSWQAGLSTSLVQHTIEKKNYREQAGGMGDTQLTLGYEYLPELEYSQYKPRGFGFLQLTLPTGKSVYESTESAGSDITGKGFYTITIGTALVKRWSKWDASVTPNYSHSLAREFTSNQEPLRVEAFSGAQLGAAIGYSPALSNWRMGTALRANYIEALRTTTSSGTSTASIKTWWDSDWSISYMPTDDYTAALTYSDQTIFGPAVNTSLSRSIVLSVSRKWLR